jgi:hypothetical protein
MTFQCEVALKGSERMPQKQKSGKGKSRASKAVPKAARKTAKAAKTRAKRVATKVRTASSPGRDVLKRLLSAVVEAITRKRPSESKGTNAAPGRKNKESTAKSRAPRRSADIPMDRIANTYTPTQTSLKAPFRASGGGRGRDQEYARGDGDDRWADEDRFTNKSGDPRIGTHGRVYEPGEARPTSARDDEED